MSVKILVVDDEKDLVDLITYNLEKEGFEVSKAYDGETALKIARAQCPDLVVLDLMLPGIQGIEVCKFIRKDPNTAAVPIIMVTAKGEEVDRVLGLEMGADILQNPSVSGSFSPVLRPCCADRRWHPILRKKKRLILRDFTSISILTPLPLEGIKPI